MNMTLGILLFTLALGRLVKFLKDIDKATDKELASVVVGSAIALTVLIWSGVILVSL